MENGVQDLIEMLITMITDAWGVPLGTEKCVIDRDKALDLLEEIKTRLPKEIEESKRMVASRNEYVGNAKREAESMIEVAKKRVEQMVDHEQIVREARLRANNIIGSAESKSNELRRIANDYADDTLRRTEEAITEAQNEIRQVRTRFRNVTGGGSTQRQPIIPEDEL